MKILKRLLFISSILAGLFTSCVDEEGLTLQQVGGRRVLWLGTSIPSMATYPQEACRRLGMKCINRAAGESFICFDSTQVDKANRVDGYSLTASAEEKERKFRIAYANGSISRADFDIMQYLSYDRLFLPVVDSADYVVIDHGFNDRFSIVETLRMLEEQGEAFDWNTRNRRNFVGALNYLIDIIHRHNPKAMIIIGGYFQNTLNTDQLPCAAVCRLQELYARKKGLPLMDTWRHLDFGATYLPNSSNYLVEFNARFGTHYTNLFPDGAGNITQFQYYCPDGVHPHSDLTDRANHLLDSVYTTLLAKAIGIRHSEMQKSPSR